MPFEWVCDWCGWPNEPDAIACEHCGELVGTGSKRTTASHAISGWTAGCGVVAATAAVALLVFYVFGGSEAGVWLARVILVVGGSTAGVVGARRTSWWGFLRAMVMPIPTLAPAWFLMVAFSNSDGDRAEANRIILVAFLLLDLPIAVAYLVQAARSVRRQELSETADPGRQLDRARLRKELDRATAGGHRTTVIRDYIDDDDGRAHLEADTLALREGGYDLESVVYRRRSGGQIVMEFVALVAGGMSLGDGHDHIIATFRR